jgi:hypothetical protein
MAFAGYVFMLWIDARVGYPRILGALECVPMPRKWT